MVLSLAILYIVLIKFITFPSLNHQRNPLETAQILDARKSNPLMKVFGLFIDKYLLLSLDNDCLVSDIRFMDLYINFPLHCDVELSQFRLLNSKHETKRGLKESMLRDSLATQRYYASVLEFDKLISNYDAL